MGRPRAEFDDIRLTKISMLLRRASKNFSLSPSELAESPFCSFSVAKGSVCEENLDKSLFFPGGGHDGTELTENLLNKV